MVINIKKKYFFVGSQNGVDEPKDFLTNGNWRLGWFDDEDNKAYETALKHLKNMRPGDFIFLKSTFTQKNNLPFQNVNNRSASVMRILAAGIIKSVEADGHTVLVDWFKDYSDERKDWYFYTERNALWEPDLKTGRFAVELIEFALDLKEQDYSQALNTPDWSHFVLPEGSPFVSILQKNVPLKLSYEDLKSENLIAYEFRGKRYEPTGNLIKFTLNRLHLVGQFLCE